MRKLFALAVCMLLSNPVCAQFPWTRYGAQALNLGGVPQVNWRNPLSWGLAFLWVSIGGYQQDLINNDTGSYTAASPVAGKYGQQTSFSTAGAQFPNFPGVFTSNGAGTGDLTLFALTNIPASSTTYGYSLEFGCCSQLIILGGNLDSSSTSGAVTNGVIFLEIDTIGNTSRANTASGALDGNWHFIVGVVPGGSAPASWLIYKDAVLQTIALTTGLANTTSATHSEAGVGGYHDGTTFMAGQSIAIAGAFNRALSQQEISALSANPFQLLLWPADVPQTLSGPGGIKTMFVTTTSTWNPPYDWPGKALAVRACGCGGNGSARVSTTRGGHGGGGGEYAEEDNVLITGPKSVTVCAGNGATTNTTFPADSVTVTAHSGTTGTTGESSAAAGGTGSTNSIHFNGGAGRLTPTSNASGGGGGGGAGPNGTGGAAASNIGGTGDGTIVAAPAAGLGGLSGTEFDATHGIGSGGSGAASGTANGTAGGTYCGGASGAADGNAASTGGVAPSGLVIITYRSSFANTVMYRQR